MSAQMNDGPELRASGQYSITRKDELAFLVQHTTYAPLVMFLKISLHADKWGMCGASKQYLLRISGLPQSSAYFGLTKLIELGAISCLDTGYLINPIAEWHSGQLEDSSPPNSSLPEESDSSALEKNSSVLRTYPYINNIDISNEKKTPKRGESRMTRVSNISRATPSAYHGPRQPSQPPCLKAAAAVVCRLKIHELSGVWITDSAKFDTATPHLTGEEWLPYILEAWELKDTVLKNEKYPNFNAAKVINYVQHREAYRKKIPQTGAGTVLDFSVDLAVALTEKNDAARFLKLKNYAVLSGVSRELLREKVSADEFRRLYPGEKGSTVA